MMTTALPTEIEVLAAVDSTQLEVSRRLAMGTMPRAIRAETQVSGKGRFERVWHDEAGQSLLMSITFPEWADHKAPWLIGMGVAAATLVDRNGRGSGGGGHHPLPIAVAQ